MTELCAGLAQAHEAGIIHRDVKPANLMVDQDGRLKILDFGIARVADSNLTRMSFGLSQGNMQIGTPGYMSPEQIQGGEIDHRTDIFAVGAVCYELLSYREAFSGANTREIERQVMQAQPAPLASLVPGLDPEIDKIVTRALAKDRNQRYPTRRAARRGARELSVAAGPVGYGLRCLRRRRPRTANAGRTPHGGKPRTSDRLLLIKTACVTPPGDSRSKRSPKIPIMRVRVPSWHASNPERLPPAARHAPSGRSRQAPPTAPRTSVTAGVPPAPDPPTLLGELDRSRRSSSLVPT